MTEQMHVGVALDGHGWHPRASRPAPTPEPATSGRYWTELARTAERGLLDFLTIDDRLVSEEARADAVLTAARIAPATSDIGLIPVATVTHTEPFHVSKAIATLDFVSHGRAGWQPRISVTRREAALFGRRDDFDAPDIDALFDEAHDAVEVVRRLWDSWEDDAVIRDIATRRFVDRDKLHYVDFVGKRFSVKGPSITPRPPQGQPVVAALAHTPQAYRFAAENADLVFVTPQDDGELRSILSGLADAGGTDLKVYADIVVAFGGRTDFDSEATVFGGTPAELVALVLGWRRLGVDGVRLRPAVHGIDLPLIVDEVIPLLQAAGRFRTSYRAGETLRARLGLPVADNRYASVKPA